MTIYDLSSKGKNRVSLPAFPESAPAPLPSDYIRTDSPLPDVNEIEVVRHYTALSRMNFGVDSGMYPLGSCTMKHNPAINETAASLPGFTGLHPDSGNICSQGSLRILHELSCYLSAITGMNEFSLAPAAGAHGELAGVMIIKKYFESIGETRNTIIIPDTAHGTNPATVAICGFKTVEAPSDADGNVDLEKLAKLITPDTAAMMLTSPNTLGLFEKNILKIGEMLHENGSLFYCDGANLNAVVGRASIAAMGFDLMHINLHKTFSTPHGGGGPGSGPIGVTDKLVKFLPIPLVRKGDSGFFLQEEHPDSIGRIHSYYGNFLVALKAYAYICSLGAEGIRDVSAYAVLNANYLMERLKKTWHLPIKRRCMHEFILNDKDLPNHVTTNDVAKRLLDYGYHSPTVYFPLLIPGAMMIEPTETETINTLNSFVETMEIIRKEADDTPELILNAPVNTPVRRVDVVTAARKPVLKWQK
jgi:glycine dehydrogenase subunit 2